MFEYACFLHPQNKSADLDGVCPDCKRPYRFPLDVLPPAINGKAVEASLGRGFYGCVYRTKSRRNFAVKVIPKDMYAAPPLGHGKSFDDEADAHADLSDDPEAGFVASYIDAGEETLTYGDVEIECYWLEMEYVPGRLLSEVIESGPEPRQAAQIALDLLDVVDVLQARGRFHNDLHADNLKVVDLVERNATRRRAIDPRIALKVFDLGSLGDKSKSTPERLGDVHWVATHILDMLDAFERHNPRADPGVLRLNAQLRRVAEFYSGDDPTRRPTASDMKTSINQIYAFGERPWSQPVRLGFVAEHYNAQSLPPWFAPELLIDPQGEWTKRLSGPGPTLVAGMRGCGKTILLRSLEWTARVHPRRGEDLGAVRARVGEDRFLGLFVSCSALLRRPRSEPPDVPLHRLFLAYAREVVRDVHACELEELGTIDYFAVDPFVELVSRVVPWFSAPASRVDIVGLERALDAALQDWTGSERVDGSFNARTAFDQLATASRRLVDLWQDKTLLFMLDDVSIRYLPLANVEHLLSQLSLQSPDFGFKISTESQTLQLTTPGGEPARRYRDFDFFDLGFEVFAKCDPKSPFLEEILTRRTEFTDTEAGKLPKQVLSEQSLIDIAASIRREPAKTPVYWGLQALAGMCNGDIGDILRLYTAIAERARALNEYPLSPREQHDAALALTENRLVSLAGRGEWLYLHAIAFAQASNRELLRSDARRLRQYTGIRINIEQDEAEEIFPRILDLIDAGVFVLTGSTNRTKGPHQTPYVQFKLAYSPLLGLTNRIPLSKRDRFEPASTDLLAWLERPSAAKLQVSRRTKNSDPIEIDEPPQTESTGGSVFSQIDMASLDIATPPDCSPEQLPKPHLLFDVETVSDSDLASTPVEWGDTGLIAAVGFEERSVGAWESLIATTGRPMCATLVSYPDSPGRHDEISTLVTQAGIPATEVSARLLSTEEELDELVAEIPAPLIAVDVTAFNKALIYGLVRTALLQRGEVVVLHTEAAEYFPPDAALASVVDLLQAGDHLKAFQTLDEQVKGEVAPYRTVTVGRLHRDPSQPPVMATFIALKFNRVGHLLEDLPVEQVFAIAPTSSQGEDSPRSAVARYLARYFVQRYGGAAYEVGSLDHHNAYLRLRQLHRDYALGGGHNFEIALTGSKMHTVAAAMLGATARLAGVHYSKPERFKADSYTNGSGPTRVLHLRRVETR